MMVKQIQPRKTYRKGKPIGTIDYYFAYKDLGGTELNRSNFHKPFNDLIREMVEMSLENDIDIRPLYITGTFGARYKAVNKGIINWKKTMALWKKKYGDNFKDVKNKSFVRDNMDYLSFDWHKRYKGLESFWYFLKSQNYRFQASFNVRQSLNKKREKGINYFYK
jgi:hypothetical protein